MDTVKFILGLPENVNGIGNIYPIKMKHYDDFMKMANLILLDYAHFGIDVKENKDLIDSGELKLFDYIYDMIASSENSNEMLAQLIKLFSLCTRSEVTMDDKLPIFHVENGGIIHRFNFENFRKVVMKQNLLFSPKVYKDKKVQEIAEKVLKARAKNGLKSSIEDMIGTVAIFGKSYDTLAEYTIYQLRFEFNRVLKLEKYRTTMLFKVNDYENKMGQPEHFAEELDLFKSPYDDVFKEKSSFKNINGLGI